MRMKLFAVLLIAILGAPLAVAAEEVHVEVNGLVCGFCAQGIKKTFSKIDSVSDVQVDLAEKRVTIAVKDGEKIADEEIRKLITEAGYTVVGIVRR